jgi:hypothetical protein
MDFMENFFKKYRGPLYFLSGAIFLSLALYMSSKTGMQSDQSPSTNNPKIPFFILGMAVPAVAFLVLKRKSSASEEEPENQEITSPEDYKRLIEQTRTYQELISRNNRLYLGSVIVGWGASKMGELSGNPLFGNPFVISFVYILMFFACIQQLIKGRKLEDRIAAYSIQGIQLEKIGQRAGWFHELVKESQAFQRFSLIFFRLVIPVWLLYCAIDFGVIGPFSNSLPEWQAIIGTTLALALACLFLWNIGCKPHFRLYKRMKEMAV